MQPSASSVRSLGLLLMSDPRSVRRAPFAVMAAEIGLNETTLDAAAALVRRFYMSAFDDEEPQ